MRSEAKVVATVFAISAFAVAVVAGLYSGNDARTILWRAIVSMIACQVLGMVAGSIIERVLVEHEARYRDAHPIQGPKLDTGVTVVDEAVDESVSENRAAA